MPSSVCIFPGCRFYGKCDRCNQTKCDSCIIDNGENWADNLDEMICPTCIGHVQFADQIEYYEALDRL
jgi:hypothetical protein